jgi:hypothetical protein
MHAFALPLTALPPLGPSPAQSAECWHAMLHQEFTHDRPATQLSAPAKQGSPTPDWLHTAQFTAMHDSSSENATPAAAKFFWHPATHVVRPPQPCSQLTRLEHALDV